MTREQGYHRVQAALRWPMIGLTIIFLVVVLLPLQSGVPPSWLAVARVLELVIWAIFVIEYFGLLILAPDKSDYLSTHIIEAFSVLLPAMRIFRLISLLRFMRLLRAGRSVTLLLVTIRGLHRTRVIFRRFRLGYVVLASILIILSGSGILLLSESGRNSAFSSYPRCLWWSMFTAISNSFDLGFPVTAAGKAVGAIMMIMGIGLAGIYTAVLASVFLTLQRDEREPVQAPLPLEQSP